MAWKDLHSLHSEIGEMFDGFTSRSDEMLEALQKRGAYHTARRAATYAAWMKIKRLDRTWLTAYRAYKRDWMREYRKRTGCVSCRQQPPVCKKMCKRCYAAQYNRAYYAKNRERIQAQRASL